LRNLARLALSRAPEATAKQIGGNRMSAHIDARCKLEVPPSRADAMLPGIGLRFVKVVTLPRGS
jgi:hypothetical protein